MKSVNRLLLVALIVLSLLVVGIVPAFGYTTYYVYGNQYSTKSSNGFYNPGTIVVKYGQYYQPTTPTAPVVKQPTPAPQPPAATPPPASPTVPTTGLSADETKMVNLVNQERTKQGVRPLGVNMTLVSLARQKSQDMIAKNYFSHTSPTYGSPFDMMRNAGVTYKTAGENLAGAATTESAHQNLMNSSGHRANILNAAYNQVGIGIVSGGAYGKMFTQMFIGN